MNISIVIDCQRIHQGLIDGSLDVLPLVFSLDVVGNKKSTNMQKSVVKFAQDTGDAGISACMERSNTMQSNLQMHEIV